MSGLSGVNRTISFDSALFGKHVQQGFASLYNTQLFSDVTLIVGHERILGHKAILASFSPYYKVLFEGNSWSESGKSELKVSVTDEEVPMFKAMLQFIYTGSTTFPETEHNLVQLIGMANFYGVVPLKEAVGDLLGKHVRLENLFWLLDVAESYDVAQLRTVCGFFVAKNISYILTNERYLNLSLLALAELLKQDGIKLNQEEHLFEIVLDYVWSKYTAADQREHALKTLLPLLRFPLMSPSFLLDRIEADTRINGMGLVHQILYESFRRIAYAKAPLMLVSAVPRAGHCRFDRAMSSPSVELTENFMKAEPTSTNWCTIFLTKCIEPNTGVHRLSYKVHDNNVGMIGFAKKDSQTSNLFNGQYLGQSRTAWSWYASSATLYRGYGSNAKRGDVVTAIYNSDNGELSYELNGIAQGLAYSDIPAPIFPAVSLCGSGLSIIDDLEETIGKIRTKNNPNLPKPRGNNGAAGAGAAAAAAANRRRADDDDDDEGMGGLFE